MTNLPSEPSSGGAKSVPDFNLDPDRKEAHRHLIEKDPNGSLFSTVLVMDNVEDWVIARLVADPDKAHERADVGGGSTVNVEEVRARLQRLSEIISQYRLRIPPDHYALVQLLGWMKSSECFYALDYLTQYQSDFTTQFIEHCRRTCQEDAAAELALQRIQVLYRTRLLDRIMSPENCEFVMNVLLSEA